MAANLDKAKNALQAIPADLPHEEWVRAGMAAQAAGLDFETFDAWSAQGSNYDRAAARDAWKSFKPNGGIGPGTLYHLAKKYGGKIFRKARPALEARLACHGRLSERTRPVEVWGRCILATDSHHYVQAKQGLSDGLRVVPDGDSLRIAGESMVGALVVPVLREDGSLSSLQFVPAPEVASRRKAAGKSAKLNLPGSGLDGWFTVGKTAPGCTLFVVEGIGQAWACWKATGHPAVVCFGWGRVRTVAARLRQFDPSARLVLVPDVGKEAIAEKVGRELGAAVARMPEGWDNNTDVNDLAARDGLGALKALLSRASAPPEAALGLSVAFADELPEVFSPPDELLQGVLTADAVSMLYGDTNTGKTALVIDIAAAVARGVPWMGRETEPGLVVYLAAESPASVCGRLQAYQAHHRVKVPNFAIVRSPIDLFDSDADADAVIGVVRQLERERGKKVRLIVGDTLARLSAGANENAGQDMGMVVRRIDRIRTELAAHFLLVHHSGKAAANGARGWSGVRAAVDTEIEVTDMTAGRCAEITKQRDLGTKGERIGFRLEPVVLGTTKWGSPATSCVVVAADAPSKPQGKRVSEVGGAVLEYLRSQSAGVKKRAVVEHFQALYDRSAVYRELKKLVEAGFVLDSTGIVAAVSEVRSGAK